LAVGLLPTFSLRLRLGLGAFAHVSPPVSMDAAILRPSPMRASTEELPRVAKAHQGNSGSFAGN
jgi:hypothetical protein